MHKSLRWFVLAAAIVVADRLTKIAVLQSFGPGESLAVTSFLNLVLVFNKGAAFSFLAGAQGWQTWFFAAIALVATVVISVLLWRLPGKVLFSVGLALILGGALGNLWDRLELGHVVDFVDIHFGGWHWPAFNVADSGITVGAGILILESFMHDEAGSEKRA